MLKPMPSPNGTNFAGAFLPPNFPMRENPVAAYDSAEGAPLLNDNVLERLLRFLRERLEPDLFAQVKDALNARSEMAADSMRSYVERKVREELRLTKKVPAMAVDPSAAGADFAERFPEADRIGHVW